MKKSQIHIIIVLMGIALLGLIALQVYWIRKAVELSEENFNTSVNDALNQVAQRLEQEEFNVFFVQAAEELDIVKKEKRGVGHNAEPGKQQVEHSITVKIKGDDSGSNFTEVRTVTSRKDSLDIEQLESIDVRKGAAAQRLFDSVSGNDVRAEMIVISTDSLAPTQKSIHQLEWNDKYLDAFQQTLIEIQMRGGRIEDRLDSTRIDSLIALALQDQGVNQEYRFWVESSADDSQSASHVVFKAGNLTVDELDDSRHKVQLFPAQGLERRSFLHAYFPRQQLYTMRDVWWMTAASVLFTSIILICFGLTIRTIFRQKKLSEIKNDFINNMTHELKTPLATISLAADSLRGMEGPPPVGQIDRYTGIIKEENQRMHRQVERVLQAARFDRGEVALRLEQVDAHMLIQQAATPFRMRIEERKGTLQVELKADSARVWADRVHFSNIIHNLLDNAAKYSPDTPQIQILTRQEGTELVIQVVDQGKGIKKADQAYIFDRFYRVPAGDLHEEKGFGLGLSYVREMVEAHGGTIAVRSKLHAGSTFTIRLPLLVKGAK